MTAILAVILLWMLGTLIMMGVIADILLDIKKTIEKGQK